MNEQLELGDEQAEVVAIMLQQYLTEAISVNDIMLNGTPEEFSLARMAQALTARMIAGYLGEILLEQRARNLPK